MRSKILKVSRSFVVCFSAVLFALLGGMSLVFTAYLKQDEYVYYKWDIFPLTLLLVALVLVFLLWIYRQTLWQKIPLGTLRKVLVAYALIFGTVWVFMARNQPYADAHYVYGFAQGFVQGDFTTIPENYLGSFPYQLGLALYYELIMRLVGPDCFYFLQMVNVGMVAISFLLLNFIADEIFEDTATRFYTCLLLFGCLPPLFFVTFVYSTQLGLTLGLFALYSVLRFLRQRQAHWLVFAAFALGMAVVLKQNYWIFTIAIAIILLLDIIKKVRIGAVAGLAGILAVCMLAPQLVYLSYQARSGYSITAGSPPILHIAMGMQEGERAPGWYNGYVSRVFDGVEKNYDEATEQAKQDIANRLGDFARDPLYALQFYGLKTASQWADPSFAGIQISYFGGRNLPPLGYIPTSIFWGQLRNVLEGYMEIYMVLIYGTCLAAFLLNRKKLQLNQLLPVIVVIGGFLFHILWEAKSQYTWPYFMLCIPYAALGLTSLLQKVNGRLPAPKLKNSKAKA